MKRNGIFPGILLIGVGLFFLLRQLNLPYVNQLFTWPSILLVIGIAFLVQSYVGRESNSLFPGWLLFLLGLHFHFLIMFSFWPNHWAMFTVIVGLSFLMVYSRTNKDGLIPAIILLLISALGFFYSGFIGWFQSFFHVIEGFWPIALIAVGLYLILKKK
ncbi:LiaF transmembrane domain-containing protein [Bacillus sp. FJAT-45350]|uniref:LiaF transmembrane domain-containing protein n=1 Tax=Bacillus sp. FJAT-45350 TaxID=2011014 RepID=UPI000BB75EAB|nr:DUF5668 domain-containing protein [Bacillus sp. FJAT-45350]